MESTSDKAVVVVKPAVTGQLFDFQDEAHPATVAVWNRGELTFADNGTHFGFVQRGRAVLTTTVGRFELAAGMYFSIPGTAQLAGEGCGFVVTRISYRGFLHLGGPVEATGRLSYIDGCTDSLLVSPVVRGDPCLNLLHLPAGTNQTAHTHPSIRVGMVDAGRGVCRTRHGDLSLEPGFLFVIWTDGLHSFHTQEQSLRIVAWHPDSDFGPTHQQHPMVNRTLVDGRPIHSQGELA